MLSKKFSGHAPAAEPKVVNGIYCDYFNTLHGPGDFIDHELVQYLNIQHMAGRKVVIFSTSPDVAFNSITNIGLHPEIARVEPKVNYYHRMLEIVIDDSPKIYLQAKTLFNPKSEVFRSIVHDCLRNESPGITISPAP